MNNTIIRIEGSIFSPDILDRLEDTPSQAPATYGLPAAVKVKDEIARAWAFAQDDWQKFQNRLNTLSPDSAATTETRNYWIIPLLERLDYRLEYRSKAEEINGKLYPISHRAVNRGNLPVHIVGYNDKNGLDRRPENASTRMSAHALLQEFLNLDEQLYGIVTNGKIIRLLRDSSRLVKLSYLEFDLDQILGDELYSEFALLYRLLHATRMPNSTDTAADSLIEKYHQDSLESGARIRSGLSNAVENAIVNFGNGFLKHPQNTELRRQVDSGGLTAQSYYQKLLRLIYRLLFLMVIEERDLVYPEGTATTKRELYRKYYSIYRLRLLSEKRFLADPRHDDLWMSLMATFSLFESSGLGEKLGIAPLAGDLFGREAIGLLADCTLGNDVLLGCLRSLSLYEHPDSRQLIRVNYGALNVEEFGSVYEGLLEYEPVFTSDGGSVGFGFTHGDERAATGSHYTPDELVQPLIKHSLDYLIAERVGSGERRVAVERAVSGERQVVAERAGSGERRAVAERAGSSERRAVGDSSDTDMFTLEEKKDLYRELVKRRAENGEQGAAGEGGRDADQSSVPSNPARRSPLAAGSDAGPDSAHRSPLTAGQATKEVSENAHKILSGPGSMAAGHDHSGDGLRTNQSISEGGTVRSDVADPAGSHINSGEHSGGLGAGDDRGVHSVPANRPGEPSRTGDAHPADPANPAHHTGTDRSDTGKLPGAGTPAHHAATEPYSETEFLKLWSTTPLATRRSLLAERALLSLRVADISCGSGHILLAAARRIATELAKLRTGEDQPSPTAYRAALRDVIRECIYGVDLNPLAVELCKVALWLEAHNPGQPLNFLDHHIKCGNSIVGYLSREELDKGVPDEAFTLMPGDEKEIGAALRKQNKAERENKAQIVMDFSPEVRKHLDAVLAQWNTLSALPERVPAEIEEKKARFAELAGGSDAWLLNQVAAIPIAQFYIPKTDENAQKIITNAQFLRYWRDAETPIGQATAASWATAIQKRFFHWFLEFPEIMAGGGFDCILGNPPYLGRKKLSGTYGYHFCEYVKYAFAPTGLTELVNFFMKRIYSLLRPNGFMAIITTNSVADGDVRRDGLEQLLDQGGQINMVQRGLKWTGTAHLFVSELSLYKGQWLRNCLLDGKVVDVINAYFEDAKQDMEPLSLQNNQQRICQGSIFLGKGFVLKHEDAKRIVTGDPKNSAVVYSSINGDEINNVPDQSPQRSIIDFHDWSIDKAKLYTEPYDIVRRLVIPDRLKCKNAHNRVYWWIYDRRRPELYAAIHTLGRCFVATVTTKYLNFSEVLTAYVFTNALYVLTTDRWDIYVVVQSTLHEVWARKHSGSLGQGLRYSPTDCFETYVFPGQLWQMPNPSLAAIGKKYHQHRKALMLSLWLGLTDVYNLFHSRDLTPEIVVATRKTRPADAGEGHHVRRLLSELRRLNATEGSNEPPYEPDEELDQVELFTDTQQCFEALLELRHLHVQMDIAVRDAYGWQDLNLEHGFYEVDTLPENDRVRYTISPTARKELLRRLLELNLQRAAEESAAKVAAAPAKPKRGKKASADGGLFE